MATLERTAYPRLPKTLSNGELKAFYTPTVEELEWVRRSGRSTAGRLRLLVFLKVFGQLHYFPPPEALPEEIVAHVRSAAGIGTDVRLESKGSTTLYRHFDTVRKYLGVTPYYGAEAEEIAIRAAHEAAAIMDQQVDIINATIDELIARHIELPAFSTLNKIAEQVHATTQTTLFRRVARRLAPEDKTRLDRLLSRDFTRRQSAYHGIKRNAQRPSRKHLEILLDHLSWLEGLGDFSRPLSGIPATKLRSLANQAMQLDAANLKETRPEKRYTLMLALIDRMRVRTRDDLAEMFIRRIGTIHKRAREELADIQARQRGQMEALVGLLDGVVDILTDAPSDVEVGQQIRRFLAPEGDLEPLRESCAAVRAFSGGNHLPLLWKHFRAHRSMLLRLAQALDLDSTTQDRSLVRALQIMLENESLHREWIDAEVDLSFASERWRKLVRRPHHEGPPTNRRYLEVCVFSYMANELRSGDLCVVGSEAFADYRTHLLPWQECERRLPDYCAKVGIPSSATEFVAQLREWLSQTALTLDQTFPHQREHVTIGHSGEPVLKRTVARDIPGSVITLQQALLQRMPTRHILDILTNIEHWTHFTRHFGPLSGSDPKLKRAAERYLLAIFAMGCNLGPTQAARHIAGGVSPHMLSFVNRRHMSLEKLETAQRELIELYLRLDLPKHWGDGKTVAADGTQYDFYDDNLLAGYHFRYRKMGAVAYRHVADNYIAVFRHFIPPGVWEAIYVIEGLLKAGLSVEADTVHSDTQGQSAAVFAFTHLLGIKLMPRIRNWHDLSFSRPDADTTYRHIDRLFGDPVNWELIASHWQDLMQVALSIQAGTISSPLLLRKLGSYSRKNRLFLAAQELGKIVRTVFLLEWIGSRELRQEVTATTNKIESYNGFAKWFSFGGDVIAENDPDEQQKRLRYNDLIASSVILQNTVDMMRVLREMANEGTRVNADDIGFLSPYLTSNVKRFGDYQLHLNKPPESWIGDSLFGGSARSSARPSQT